MLLDFDLNQIIANSVPATNHQVSLDILQFKLLKYFFLQK